MMPSSRHAAFLRRGNELRQIIGGAAIITGLTGLAKAASLLPASAAEVVDA
jgi:hypothetical protein